MAAAQGAVAADNAIGNAARTVDMCALPRVTFTSPQTASAGMTEVEAAAQGLAVDSRLLGVHILAEGAGEVIAAAVYAIKVGMTVAELAETWSPSLTMAEGLRLTAQKRSA